MLLLCIVFLFGRTDCSRSMIEMWGAPSGTYYAINASEYKWEDCMVACFQMDDCILAAEQSTDVGCDLFTYYNISSVIKTDPYTTKIAFKMSVPDVDTCPEATNPPLFGNTTAFVHVVNPNSTAPSTYHQAEYSVSQAATGKWSLTFYPCYNDETPISINSTMYCILALTDQTNATDAVTTCAYKGGSVVGPLDADQFSAMTAVAALSGNTFWTSGTFNVSSCSQYSEGYNTADSNAECGANNLFKNPSGANIVGSFQSNYPCSGGSCNSCLAISSGGLKDVPCTGSNYVMCLAKAYTVTDKTVQL